MAWEDLLLLTCFRTGLWALDLEHGGPWHPGQGGRVQLPVPHALPVSPAQTTLLLMLTRARARGTSLLPHPADLDIYFLP